MDVASSNCTISLTFRTLTLGLATWTTPQYVTVVVSYSEWSILQETNSFPYMTVTISSNSFGAAVFSLSPESTSALELPKKFRVARLRVWAQLGSFGSQWWPKTWFWLIATFYSNFFIIIPYSLAYFRHTPTRVIICCLELLYFRVGLQMRDGNWAIFSYLYEVLDDPATLLQSKINKLGVTEKAR